VRVSFQQLGKCKCTNKLGALQKAGNLRLRNSLKFQEMAMYAVIRAGGKQYRVAPGDVIEIEKLAKSSGDNVQFDDVLAVSATEGEIAKPAAAFVTGEVVEQGRGDKVLVFHYKRKKQYKKLQGHRQDYTAVKITGISVDGKALQS
jgi:large subunit ribosomal protein L21